ncbi:hypothetical protein KVQ01_19025 [Escherichia coli]|uniref:Uncharacterized protein n=1 Tax=Escherichia coli 1-250-04_S3_C1 TaxID=1444135 RepID=A0AAN4NTK0_ECOLX|nr:hypothetical protein [Escherichia coli]EZJ85380.1 hypothetical protein AC00_2305 [Escherichia coli 1-250-04_S3_C1]KEO32910.1 hypothetical protein AC28_2289 [Escherichia coli 1-250-04_S3_C2]MCH0687067.1 hypothetical protein [Escherichia coli]MDZ8665149.1 hypothetical protein [Escherichia coli]WRX85980.1 hypothetical protein SM938_12900 [Escherichia coli]
MLATKGVGARYGRILTMTSQAIFFLNAPENKEKSYNHHTYLSGDAANLLI